MIPTAAACILIVDDELPNRRLLEALLHPEGYLTRTASSGAEALASVAEHPPDLILLDVMMPAMDGHRVAAILKSDPATRHIPIIMVTALIDREARLKALEAGAEEFLSKPVDRAELWLRVRNLLRLKEFGDYLQNHRAMLELEVRARTADLQQFRTAMDATADAILLIERRTMQFVEVNSTACDMLGYARDELLALGPIDLQPGSNEQLAERHRKLIAGGGTTESLEILHRKDGSQLPVEAHLHAQGSGDEQIIVAVLRDISERNEAERLLQHLAHYDALTGLPNRTLFYDTLEQTLGAASAKGWTVGVLFVDLDHFKNVNDTLGHAIGDELLIQVSQRLAQCVRIRDTVGRLGGDEFALILLMEEGPKGAGTVARKIQQALRAPFTLSGHELTVTASVGITSYPQDSEDRDTLIKFADIAMYRAKHAGRDTFRFFTASMNTEALARLELEIDLRRAARNGEFVLHYQPKLHLERGGISGLEALLRWERPGQGLVSPAEFIPLLEETGLIVDVGRWVINAVCQQIGCWLRSGVGPIQVSVNVSGRQFIEGDLDGDVTAALTENEVPANLIELELTESSLMANTDRTIATLESLKESGVRISIDDFGTGYSSLSYLRRFPIDKLKIDISFVRDITTNPDDAAIAVTIIRMAHGLNLDVIAEGVETAAQREYLRRNHCDQMQGYYFSPALPVPAVEELLLAGAGLPAPEAADAAGSATLLLVDEDQVVLDALRALLAEDGYRILVAHTAAEGFELLALHDIHVILCDPPQTGPEGLDFLDRVKELHPDALRIVLSSGVGEDALIDTINRGEVYRCYKKPWHDAALRKSVRGAFRFHRRMHGVAVRNGIEPVTPQADGHPPRGFTFGTHEVHLWETTDEIIAAVADFWIAGIEGGEDFVMVATPGHRAAVEARLAELHVDPTRTRFATFDAAETLASLMVDGAVDANMFDVVIGTLIRAATAEGRRLRVYGQMVGLLWNDDAITDALRLEMLWNELAAEAPFRLLCGYEIGENAPGDLVAAVCSLHDDVSGRHPTPHGWAPAALSGDLSHFTAL